MLRHAGTGGNGEAVVMNDWLHITEGGMDGSVQQACMDSLFGGAKSEPSGEWTEMDLNGISRWQKQDDGAADIIWKSAD